MPFQTVASAVKYKPPFLRKIVNGFMVRLGEKLVLTKSVNALLFEGFNDTLLELARKMKVTNLPYSKFAWFYGVSAMDIKRTSNNLTYSNQTLSRKLFIFFFSQRNDSATYDGVFNMLTGATNLYDMGMLKEWNYSNRTNTYANQCGRIGGSLGDFWPPLKDNKTITIFIPDICT